MAGDLSWASGGQRGYKDKDESAPPLQESAIRQEIQHPAKERDSGEGENL